MMIRRFILSACLFVSQLALAVPADVDTCFTPGDYCDIRIINAIDHAQRTIDVQAYQLTSQPIISSLIAANERGIEISVILDKTQARKKGFSPAQYLFSHHIPVWIDRKPAIAHNKVMIIDDKLVITGSYNFTRNAQYRNAENVVFITSQPVADRFRDNFYVRLSQSQAIQ
jgi:phosphatidylserine/phosphatidylglycerophosphate/cardiolipin synthase-like enzyme